jgi:hypothetical protein
MKKVINFGKVDYNNIGKPINRVTVEVKFNDGKLSICANIWNGSNTDIVCGGQCIDTLQEFDSIKNNELFTSIYRLWKLYHLNDMHAGTIEQENAIKEWEELGNKYDYTEACNYLKSINLYEVSYNGSPYTYGHSWLFQEIPLDDVKIINQIMTN